MEIYLNEIIELHNYCIGIITGTFCSIGHLNKNKLHNISLKIQNGIFSICLYKSSEIDHGAE